MNPTELRAKDILEKLLPTNIQVRYVAAQHAGSHHFDLVQENGRVVPLVVTRSKLEPTPVLEGGGIRVNRVKAWWRWWVAPRLGASIPAIREGLDDHLAAVEAAGPDRVIAKEGLWSDTDAGRALVDLGVDYAFVLSDEPQPHKICWQTTGGGLLTTLHINRAVEREARKEDNVRKLAVKGLDEAHLFVEIQVGNFMPWVSLVEGPLPAMGPDVPPTITHVWAYGALPGGREELRFGVWRWSRGHRWEDLGPVLAFPYPYTLKPGLRPPA